MNHPQPAKPGVPKLLPVLIIALLAGMYYLAAYIDVATPEKTIDNFYEAYFEKDYETVANNLSVFWSVNMLPQYQDLSAAELLQKRDEIVKDTADKIKSEEADQPQIEGLSVVVMDEHTKTGEYSALVVYQVLEHKEPVYKEVAFLIKEAGGYKIITSAPIEDSDLDLLKEYRLDQLDASFKILLGVQ